MSVQDALALLTPPAYLATHKESRVLFLSFIGRHVGRRLGLHFNEALRKFDRVVTRDVQRSSNRPAPPVPFNTLPTSIPMQKVTTLLLRRALEGIVRRRRSGQPAFGSLSIDDSRWLIVSLTVHAVLLGCFAPKPSPIACELEEDLLRWVELVPQSIRQEIALFQKGSSVLSLESSLSGSTRSPRGELGRPFSQVRIEVAVLV